MIESLLQAERLLVVGQVDGAEKIYESTLAADPRNSIAMVGLARVALERGDDRLAYRHTCDALDIDRQNAAALRLEARLSEVLAARGEPVERPAWLAKPAPAPKTAPPQPKAGKRRGLLGRILRG
jgi:Tfp pilus assembly protein PilF